ncbi:NAD(P)H-hydrate epimerase [Thermohalobacter berrensis]|uniref:NAD(P)H-hydrate epimerase n=1 Tax=Thermohalobacter berrensis TaxID=99594 RepID=A0A419T7A5_9FIRM|nr:NAD(P)H-hydrate epimerase [Thermohalobacter berrensis]RKD33467.1 NAD(P)H-hydrate epimerase [Thermohalobacter berrensis]
MKVATANQMRSIDKYCIENIGIPGIVLMENAALKVVENIDKYDSFTIVAGTGNNGGDGLAIARHLIVKNKKANIYLIGTPEKMSKDCKINYNILLNMNVKINTINQGEDLKSLKESVSTKQVTVDSIFGTGLSGEVRGIYSDVISIINKYSSYTVSVDIPSGLECDTGKVLGISVKADKTVTFQLNKKGFLNPESKKYTGKVKVESIGIPNFVVEKFI